MSKALLLAALLGVASCGPAIVSHGDTGRLTPRLGSKKCSFGPSYWCDHVSKSSECGMTSWCIDNVWQHMDLPEDTDDVCAICQEMVKEARDQLNSNETQEELKEVLEGSCNLIPLRLIAEECDTLVDDFIPELTEMLTSQMNPQVVCKTAGLCNSARVDKLLEDRHKEEAQWRAPETCTTCEIKMNSLKQAVAAGGPQQLLDRLLPVCRELGSYSDACAGDLATHIEGLFNFVPQLNSQGVCLLGNVCPGLFDEPSMMLRRADGPAVDCDLCIHIVKHWRDILVANTTKEEFKEILDGICKQTKVWGPKCTQLVDEYYVIIYDFLVNQMRAHTICKAIGLCSAPQSPLWLTVPADSEAAAALRPLIPLEAAQPRLTLEAVPLAALTPATHSVVAKKGDHPKKKLHSVKLQKSVRHSYGADGLSHSNPLDSAEPAAAVVSVPQQLPLSRLGLPDLSGLFQRDTELCDLCEFGLHELQKVLQDDATEDEITEEVSKLCDLLPGTLTGRCHQFVSDYGTFVIQMLAEQMDPTEVCPALRLCPLPSSELSSSSEEEVEEQQQAVQEKPGCAICEYAMNTLLKELQDKKTEEEIREGLDRVCEMLPATVSRECQELVNTFIEEIIDMVVSGMTADQICITLRLCQPTASSGNDVLTNSIHALPESPLRFAGFGAGLAGLPMNSPRMPAEPLSSESSESSEEDEDHQVEAEATPVCILCEFTMMQLKVKLQDNSTDEQIETELLKVCGYMPLSVRKDCNFFVNTYGPELLDQLEKDLSDPDGVCRQLQLCEEQEQISTGSEP